MEKKQTVWNQSVTGVVFRNGCVHLARHTYGAGKGMLILPGGYLEAGETPQEALRREFLEETGVEVQARAVVGIRFNTRDWYVAFAAVYVSGEPRSDGDENSEVLWIPVEEALAREDGPDLSKKLIRSALAAERGLCRIPYGRSDSERGEPVLFGIPPLE